MVAAATRRFHDPDLVRGLRDLGRVSKWPLHVWPVSLAVLLARDLRRLTTRVVRSAARLVAETAAVLTGIDHPAVPGPVSSHVLLLSRRVLQGVLGGSAELRRG